MHYIPYLCYKSFQRNIKYTTIFWKSKDFFFQKRGLLVFKNPHRFYISLEGFIAYIRYIMHMLVLSQQYIPHAFTRWSGSPMRTYGVQTSAERRGKFRQKIFALALNFSKKPINNNMNACINKYNNFSFKRIIH